MKAISIRRRGLDHDAVFDVIVHIVMFALIVITAYPLVLVVSCSISNPKYVMQGTIWLLPKEITFNSYLNVIKHERLVTGFKNSVYYTLLATTFNVVLTICAAYPLSRKDWVGRKIFFTIMVVTMFFSGGTIPLYLVVKGLHLTNKVWSLVLPTAISTYNVIVMRTYFESSVTEELRESAQIDGCSNLRFLLQIVLPLSIPILCIITMFYGVEHWNEFYAPLLYLSKRKMYPLQLVLREILMTASATMADSAGLTEQMYEVEGIKYATIVVSSLPMIIAYPFMQRYFQKGIMVGAIKG